MKHYFYSLMTDQKKGFSATLVKGVLALLAKLFQFLLLMRGLLWRWGLFRAERVPVKVISVGNITVGGTGKTPFVKWLVKFILLKGKKVAILSRGYHSLGNGFSDEILELRKSLPEVLVWVGKDRAKLAAACAKNVDTVILDDGFQYWRLARDLDIVLVDATNPFGNGEVLPRGILRERPGSLRRADMVILTRADREAVQTDSLERLVNSYAPGIPILFSAHRPRRFYEARAKKEIPIEILKREKIVAFCGIGNPGAFQEALQRHGIRPLESLFFMDHHRYREADLKRLDRSVASLGADRLLTTEKDLARLEAVDLWPSTPLAVLEVEVIVTKNEDTLLRRLDTLFSS